MQRRIQNASHRIFQDENHFIVKEFILLGNENWNKNQRRIDAHLAFWCSCLQKWTMVFISATAHIDTNRYNLDKMHISRHSVVETAREHAFED